MKEHFIKIAEWLATLCIIVASIALAADFTLVSTILFCLGSVFWIIVAIVWCKSSLAVTNGFIVIIYIAGFFGLIDYIKTFF